METALSVGGFPRKNPVPHRVEDIRDLLTYLHGTRILLCPLSVISIESGLSGNVRMLVTGRRAYCLR